MRALLGGVAVGAARDKHHDNKTLCFSTEKKIGFSKLSVFNFGLEGSLESSPLVPFRRENGV